MKKSVLYSASILLIVLFTLGAQWNITPESSIAEVVDEEDSLSVDTTKLESILDIVLALNGENMPAPPRDFRKGHVNPTNADVKYTQTADGFVIQLPSSNGVPTPTVKDGRLYVSGGFGSKQYFCFDATTGQKIWGTDLDDDGPSSGVIEDGILVFNTESCTIFACEEKSGKELWSYYLGDPLMSTPTISNGLVFTAFPAFADWASVRNFQEITQGKFHPSHVLIAMDLHTGAIKWKKWIDGDIIMAPVANEGKLHVVSFPGTYFVLDQKTGTFESAERLRGTSAPTFTKNGMVISRRSDSPAMGEDVSESIVTLSQHGYSERYTRKNAEYLDQRVQSSSRLKLAAAADDAGNGFGAGAPASSGYNKAMENIGQSNVSTLQSFIGSRTLNFDGYNFNTMGDSLISTHEATGEARWKTGINGDLKQVGGFLATPPIRVGSCILIATYHGDILLIDAKTGKQVRKFSTGENLRTQPVAMNGWIYVGTTNGKLVAINTKDASISDWPMLGRNAAHTN